MYPNNYPQYLPNYQLQQPQQNTTSGLVPVPNETVARNYPVQYGANVSFKDENAPYIYTKTMGFSPLETPKFEKFRLVKEEADSVKNTALNNEDDNMSTNELKSLYEAVRSDVDKLKKEIFRLKKDIKAKDPEEAAELSEVEND